MKNPPLFTVNAENTSTRLGVSSEQLLCWGQVGLGLNLREFGKMCDVDRRRRRIVSLRTWWQYQENKTFSYEVFDRYARRDHRVFESRQGLSYHRGPSRHE